MIKTLLKHLHAPIYEARLKCLAGPIWDRLVHNDKVLDVGCGKGALGAFLMKAAAADLLLCANG